MSTLEFNNTLVGLRQTLMYFALSLTANTDEADDLLQETMLKALTYRKKFTPNTNFKAWVYTIMKNTFINNYRRTVKSNQIMDRSKDLHYLNTPQYSGIASPESVYAVNDMKEGIDTLDEDYRVPFEMHNKGYKYKEIAEHLNIPIGTVKSRIFLARQRLMRLLEDYKR